MDIVRSVLNNLGFDAAVFLCIYLFSGSFLKEQDVKRLLLRNYLGDITEQQLDDGTPLPGDGRKRARRRVQRRDNPGHSACHQHH